MPVEEQVVVIHAGVEGFVDDAPIDDVRRYERELIEYVRTRHGNLLDQIRDKGDLPGDDSLKEAIKGFADQFQPSEDKDEDKDEDSGESSDEEESSDDEDSSSDDDSSDDEGSS